MLKNLLLGSAMSVVVASIAVAAPITGSFTAFGDGSYRNNSNTNVTAATATRLDFGSAEDTKLAGNGFGRNGSVLIGPTASGSFAAYRNTFAAIADLQFSGTPMTAQTVRTGTANGSSPFITFSNPFLSLSILTSTVERDAGKGTITVRGTGSFSDGTDSVIGNYSLTTDPGTATAGARTFSFTTNSSIPGPTPVPEPATMALLGAGLLGLAGLRRARRSA